jgi:hypothetical protein
MGSLAAAMAVTFAPALAAQDERVDLDAVYRIKEEGFQRSRVMEIASYLTDVHGPRLTGSPQIKQASDWAAAKLTEFGLASARVEPWGTFGRGWHNERFSAHVTAPQLYPLIGYPKAWTPGTNGTVTGEAILAVIERDEDFDKFRGQLRGKIVLTTRAREVSAPFAAAAQRFSEAELEDMALQPDPARRPGPPPGIVVTPGTPSPYSQQGQEFSRKRQKFYLDEGALALLESGRGDAGIVFVQGGGSRDPKDPPVAPQIVLAVEHYGRIVRTLEKKFPVTIELNVQSRFDDANQIASNVLAEIPGTDKADELVILGAHFDSWHSGTGATDNASGSAVMMEAMRILKASGVKLRRTVRIGLWTGEEQGLLGSRAYVKEQFGDRTTMQLKPAHAKVAAYFNLDNGTGAIRGVYLQSNEAVAPVFRAWMEPLANLGMTTIAIRNTSGTDHMAFNDVGLPGFQFIQDPIDYSTRTHHSNMDTYERLQASDLMKNAVIIATFAYQAANRDEKLPRKPLPKPTPPERPAGTPTADATR